MMPDNASSDEWIQTRRRFDWMIGPFCLLITVVAVILCFWTNQWSVFLSAALAYGIWFWFRQTIPAEGRPHSRARIRHDHAFMIFTAAVALPTILAICAIDWLGVKFSAWIGAGVLGVFLALMIGGGTWLDRHYQLMQSGNSKRPSDSHANDHGSER